MSYFIVEVYQKNKIWRINYTGTSTGTAYSGALYGDMFAQIETPKYSDIDGYKYINAILFSAVPREGIEIKVLGTRY
jgi:hypothetical protein